MIAPATTVRKAHNTSAERKKLLDVVGTVIDYQQASRLSIESLQKIVGLINKSTRLEEELKERSAEPA